MSEKESAKTSENFSLRLGYVLLAAAFFVFVLEVGLAVGSWSLSIPLGLFVCSIGSFLYYFSTAKNEMSEKDSPKTSENFYLRLGYVLVAAAFFVYVLEVGLAIGSWTLSIPLGLFVCGIGAFLYHFSTAKNEK